MIEGATGSDIPDGSGDEIAWLAARELEDSWLQLLHFFPHDDGMYEVEGRLPPDVTAVLIRALEAAEEELLLRERSEGGGAGSTSTEPLSQREARREAERLRADAFLLVLERVAETLEGASPPAT